VAHQLRDIARALRRIEQQLSLVAERMPAQTRVIYEEPITTIFGGMSEAAG